MKNILWRLIKWACSIITKIYLISHALYVSIEKEVNYKVKKLHTLLVQNQYTQTKLKLFTINKILHAKAFYNLDINKASKK